ncbi:MAG: cytidylyltransferase domain-containing protein [Desulfosalsimonas sp.]
MSGVITAVLPCRKGSKRVKHKNTRKFYTYGLGLFQLKLEQLLKVKSLDKIFVSTDDETIMSYIESGRNGFAKEVTLEKRPAHLAADDCLEDLIKHLSHAVETDVLLWTHVTSPFFTDFHYQQAIDVYREKTEKNLNDSLVSVSPVHTFALQGGRWISHDVSVRKWPRKQDVEKILLINGAVYIININLMQSTGDRIGENPCFFELAGLSGFDIDYEEDFKTAEKIAPCLLNEPDANPAYHFGKDGIDG